jgi:uncharacterized SAM-binding protein YcdF (DUF218 family)
VSRIAAALAAPLAWPATAPRVADAAVIFGAPPGPPGALAAPLAERIEAGAHIYRQGLAAIVCATGKPREAAAMEARLIQLGVPERALRVDRDARTTRDNARNAAAILGADGCRTAWVVTQSFHRRRACFWLRHFGIEPLAWGIEGERAARVGWLAREYAAWTRVAVDLLRHG